jgi:predicted nucleic acid-binding protein
MNLIYSELDEIALETFRIYLEWLRLVRAHNVMGVNVYDTRLVAVMLVYGLTHLLTFNTDGFRRFTEITVVHPSELMPEQAQD